MLSLKVKIHVAGIPGVVIPIDRVISTIVEKEYDSACAAINKQIITKSKEV